MLSFFTLEKEKCPDFSTFKQRKIEGVRPIDKSAAAAYWAKEMAKEFLVLFKF
jgi:hypothetical protein